MVERSCNGCTVCCEVNEVVPLRKPRNTPCPHQRTGVGCAIYGDRPHPCAAYTCSWLDGWLSDDLKPERSGLLMETTQIQTPEPLTVLVGWEVVSGQACRLRRTIEESLPRGAVVMLISRGHVLIFGHSDDRAAFWRWRDDTVARGGLAVVRPDGVETYQLEESDDPTRSP